MSGLATHWSQVPLDQLATIGSGVTKGRKLGGKATVEVPYLRVANVQAGHLALDEVKTISVLPEDVEKCRLEKGDILMTEGGDPDKLGRGAIWDGSIPDCIHQNHVFRVRLDRKRVLPEYFSRVLGSPWATSYFLKAAKQTTGIATINKTQLRAFPVPLPPLPEQKRIAAILDKADEIRRKRAEAIKLTEELLRSAFLEMFGDPVTNPKGWPVAKIGDGISKIEAGWSVGGEPRVPNESEDAVLKISAVTSGWFKPDECKAVPSHSRAVPRPMKGDLLFSRANTRELVAATCLVEQDTPGRFLPDKLWRVVPNDRLTSEYLRYALSDDGFRWQLTKQATGTSGSMLNVSKAKFLGAMIPMPNLEQQKNFATVVWQIYRARDRMTSDAKHAELLVAALTQRAFSGEL